MHGRHVKLLFLTVTIALTILLLTSYHIKATTYYATGTFHTLLLDGASIGFQNDVNKTVTVTVVSGLINSTSSKVTIYDGGGSYRFTSLNNTQIRITYSGIDTVTISGAQGSTQTTTVTSGDTFQVNAGDNVLISWVHTLPPVLPLMFIIGVTGLGAMLGGPLYTIQLIKAHKYESALVNGLTITVLGVALFIAWLWS